MHEVCISNINAVREIMALFSENLMKPVDYIYIYG
jgi:hypothetical protein